MVCMISILIGVWLGSLTSFWLQETTWQMLRVNLCLGGVFGLLGFALFYIVPLDMPLPAYVIQLLYAFGISLLLFSFKRFIQEVKRITMA